MEWNSNGKVNNDNDGNKSRKKVIALIVTIVLVLVAALIIVYFRSQIRATTMRILRIEGEVTLEDDGKPKTVTTNLRLSSGNALSTATQSLVSIGLDDTKIVTLDELSRAIFNQKGKKLDLELTDGSLFFEVQKPLEDDEDMAIRTSTMVVGIRGTSGWVSVEGDHESLIICDGHVHVIGTNPHTGETKEIEVYAGQRVSTYLYNDRSVDSIMFYVEDVTERDLPEFLLERLRENPALLDKVCRETGWDKPWILGIEVIEPTPTPVPEAETVDDDDESEDDSKEVVSEEKQEAPAKSSENNGPTEEEIEELIKKMLAMITPTPTPAPVVTPAEPYIDPYSDEEDDEEEEHESKSNKVVITLPLPASGNYTAQAGGMASITLYQSNNTQIGANLIFEQNGDIRNPSGLGFTTNGVLLKMPITLNDGTNDHVYNNLSFVDYMQVNGPFEIHGSNGYVKATPISGPGTGSYYEYYDSNGTRQYPGPNDPAVTYGGDMNNYLIQNNL